MNLKEERTVLDFLLNLILYLQATGLSNSCQSMTCPLFNPLGQDKKGDRFVLGTKPTREARCTLQEVGLFGGAWVAQSVKHLTSAQDMISQLVSSGPVSASVLTAQSLGPASDSVSPSLSAPSLLECSLSKINKLGHLGGSVS